ncbi:MAG: hypothetical protein AAB114_04010, partial [Chloroflexota bacterium]
IPRPFDPRLIAKIAPAVARAAMVSGVATRPIADFDAYTQRLNQFVYQSGLIMKPVFAAAKELVRVVPTLAVEPEAVNASVDILLRAFRDGAAEWRQLWDEALSPSSAEAVRAATRADGAPRQIAGRTWAGIVYDLLLASKRTPDRTSTYVRSLVPLYFGRVAAFIEEAADLDTARSEELVEAQARAFEARKHDLLAGWGA